MAEMLFWLIAVLTIASAAMVVLNNQLLTVKFKDSDSSEGHKKEWWNEHLIFLVKRVNKNLKEINKPTINFTDKILITREFRTKLTYEYNTSLEYDYAAIYLTDMSKVKTIANLVTEFNDKYEIDPFDVDISDTL